MFSLLSLFMPPMALIIIHPHAREDEADTCWHRECHHVPGIAQAAPDLHHLSLPSPPQSRSGYAILRLASTTNIVGTWDAECCSPYPCQANGNGRQKACHKSLEGERDVKMCHTTNLQAKNQQANHINRQRISQTNKQPNNQATHQQATNKPTNKPTNQTRPINQLANQPAKKIQPAKQLSKHGSRQSASRQASHQAGRQHSRQAGRAPSPPVSRPNDHQPTQQCHSNYPPAKPASRWPQRRS